AYAYFGWQVAERVMATVGLVYDYLRFPKNARIPPISEGQETISRLSPKAGVIWAPRTNTILRAGFSRSVEGLTFDQSFRLEPTQVAGFNQAFRTVLPPSIGSFAGVTRDQGGLALEQKIGSGTYLTIEAEWLETRGDRTIGAFDVTGSNVS